MEIIALTDVLKLMDNKAQPFTISFVTADRKRKRGGEIITWEQCTQSSIDAEHNIRRIRLRNGKTRPVHVRLITHFNAKKVIW